MDSSLQVRLNRRSTRQKGLISRADVKELGGSDGLIEARLRSGLWVVRQPGVYTPGGVSLDWEGELLAGVLAAGPTALASHRAAWLLWDLDGVRSAPCELTVGYNNCPVPGRVVRHRTRRPPEVFIRRSVPCTSLERTLIDAGRYLPTTIIERGVEDALKRGLTTMTRLGIVIEEQGGRGVPGAHRVRSVVAERGRVAAAGSPAEVRFLRMLRRFGVPDPVRQFAVRCPNGAVYIVDFAWPERGLLIEVDGLCKRWDAAALDAFLERQNDILDQGFELRRFGWRAITRRPEQTARKIAALLIP